MLQLTNLTVSFPGHAPVVEDVACGLAAGDTLGLLGLSGSGKSLTALALLGLLPPSARVDAGQALYTRADGTTVDLLQLTEKQWRKLRGREISLVFQEPLTALNPVHRVGQQLEEAVRYLCPQLTTKDARRQHLAEWLRRVELPDDQERLLRAYPHELSGGQRQRLLIALALLGEPRLLIADEPTTALDVITERGILELLEKLRREMNMALIFITHDLDVLRRTTDNCLVLTAGRVVHRGTTAEILALPGAGLTEASGGVRQIAPANSQESPGDCLRVDNLSVSYAGRKPWPWSAAAVHRAVRNVSFGVDAGEWVAIVGPSGCGKTTVARCLAGLLPVAAGQVSGPGATKVQLIFQDPFSSLNPGHSVGQILREVLRLSKEHTLTPERLLTDVELPPADYLQRRPDELSGGQRQRVAIARALAARPRLLIADEAVSALDAPLRVSILDLLDKIRREQGIGLLFITHDLRLVAERADRVIIMENGSIVEEGRAGAVLSNPQSSLAQALVAAGE